MKNREDVQEAYTLTVSFLKTFTDVTNLLYEINSQKPEIEALDTLLTDINGIKSRQDRCIDMLQQDEQILRQVIEVVWS